MTAVFVLAREANIVAGQTIRREVRVLIALLRRSRSWWGLLLCVVLALCLFLRVGMWGAVVAFFGAVATMVSAICGWQLLDVLKEVRQIFQDYYEREHQLGTTIGGQVTTAGHREPTSIPT